MRAQTYWRTLELSCMGCYQSVGCRLVGSSVGQSSYLLANWSGVVIEVKVNSINNASWLNYEDSTTHHYYYYYYYYY